VTRDGWSLEQAIETLRTNHQVELDKVLTAFCNTLSARAQRRMVSEDDAEDVANPGPAADDNIVKAERDFLAKRVLAALDRARQGLPPMDRLILKMRFEDGVAVSDIARTLHLEQRPLYRTIDALKKTIREAMLADGISRADIEALLGAEPVEWEMTADRSPQPSTHTTGRQDRKGASWLRNR
jgi:RNA polymerase sigma factor for flagellar operon FliA